MGHLRVSSSSRSNLFIPTVIIHIIYCLVISPKLTVLFSSFSSALYNFWQLTSMASGLDQTRLHMLMCWNWTFSLSLSLPMIPLIFFVEEGVLLLLCWVVLCYWLPGTTLCSCASCDGQYDDTNSRTGLMTHPASARVTFFFSSSFCDIPSFPSPLPSHLISSFLRELPSSLSLWLCLTVIKPLKLINGLIQTCHILTFIAEVVTHIMEPFYLPVNKFNHYFEGTKQ